MAMCSSMSIIMRACNIASTDLLPAAIRAMGPSTVATPDRTMWVHTLASKGSKSYAPLETKWVAVGDTTTSEDDEDIARKAKVRVSCREKHRFTNAGIPDAWLDKPGSKAAPAGMAGIPPLDQKRLIPSKPVNAPRLRREQAKVAGRKVSPAGRHASPMHGTLCCLQVEVARARYLIV